MVIEVKSVSDSRRRTFKSRVVRLGLFLFIITFTIGVYSLAHSYQHYAEIIDARLASGYLTSRPGLYAAPRVLQAGQKLSREKLVAALRGTGYLESKATDVRSGSFIVAGSTREIRP